MALGVGTDLTNINTAEATTNWVAIGAQTPAIEPDFFVQGSNSISRAVSGAATEKGMWYDNTTGINFSQAGGAAARNMLVYMWLRCNTPALIQTMANGGMSIWLGTSTTNYHEYYVGGSDYGIPDSDGWICYIIDPSKPPSKIGGTGLTLSSIRYFGATIETTATAKGQNFGIDRIAYGRGRIIGSGTSTTGKGFKDLADWDWTTNKTNRYGLMQSKNGIITCRCEIVIGDATGSVATTFTSNDEVLVWETPMYMTGTQRVQSVPNTDVSGTNYWGIRFVGNGTGNTDITIGTLVGTDKGRNGGLFIVAQNPDITSGSTIQEWRMDAQDGSVENVDIYGCNFRSCTTTSPTASFDFNGLSSGNKNFSNVYDGCGKIDFGAMETRNCTILNSVASATDGAVIWDSDTNLTDCSFINNTRSIVFESTTGTPFTFTDILFSPTTNAVRNESNGSITINISGGDTPTAENAGSSSTTIVSSVAIEINGVTEGTRCSMIGSGGAYDGVEVLAGYANSSGIVAGSFSGTTPQNVVVKARNSGIVAAVVVDDGGVFTDHTNDARDKTGTNDVNLLPATISVNDAVYFGGKNTFNEVELKVTTAGTTYVVTWEYYNGSTWSALTVTDPSNSFKSTGWFKITFTVPGNWATTSVNGQGPFYYIRARVTTGGGTQPKGEEVTLNGTTKYLPFTVNGTIVGGTGLTVTAVWVTDTNAR